MVGQNLTKEEPHKSCHGADVINHVLSQENHCNVLICFGFREKRLNWKIS